MRICLGGDWIGRSFRINDAVFQASILFLFLSLSSLVSFFESRSLDDETIGKERERGRERKKEKNRLPEENFHFGVRWNKRTRDENESRTPRGNLRETAKCRRADNLVEV